LHRLLGAYPFGGEIIVFGAFSGRPGLNPIKVRSIQHQLHHGHGTLFRRKSRRRGHYQHF